jgi:hypothetical protein
LEFGFWTLRKIKPVFNLMGCLHGCILPSLFILVTFPLLAQEDSIPPSQKLDSSLIDQKVPLLVQNDSVPPIIPVDTLLTEKLASLRIERDDLSHMRRRGPSAAKKQKNWFDTGELPRISQEITIRDYKIISYERDTTYLDTTLTIEKEYKYNYLRRDDFELMPFANVGQPYNKLGVDLSTDSFYPMLGANALNYNYMEVEDIDYYNVATPMSDLFFKTTFEEGQLLDATLTFNMSPRLNFSVAYKGFRSFGKYQFNQAESGNFRTTANYATRNGRYRIRAHIAAQDIETEANGGLINEEQFESGDTDFDNRIKIDVRFNDADNKVLGKRYYFDHLYKLLRTEKDSSRKEKTSLGIGHRFNYETKYYAFGQGERSPYFGDALVSAIEDKGQLKTMYNQVNAEFYNAVLGRLQGNVSLYNYNYFFNSTLITEDGRQIPSRLQGEEIALGAEYEKKIGGFELEGSVKYNLSGDLGVNYTTVDNYSYFAADPSISATGGTGGELGRGGGNANIRPFQENNVLNHTKIKYNKEFRLGGFALNNTVMYQNVSQANQVLNLPQWVTRNTLYFSSDVFKKAMFLQTGVTLKYFTSYTMDAYNPLLGEFYIQNGEELGGYPMLDFFINAKVQQTRIYLKAEHFNSGFGETNNYYSAPNYPYRDFVIRFGLVWNFFS